MCDQNTIKAVYKDKITCKQYKSSDVRTGTQVNKFWQAETKDFLAR